MKLSRCENEVCSRNKINVNNEVALRSIGIKGPLLRPRCWVLPFLIPWELRTTCSYSSTIIWAQLKLTSSFTEFKCKIMFTTYDELYGQRKPRKQTCEEIQSQLLNPHWDLLILRGGLGPAIEPFHEEDIMKRPLCKFSDNNIDQEITV